MRTIQYIAFEGPERAGKTSQARAAEKYLRKYGISARYLKCGGLGGETSKLKKIRRLVLKRAEISDELKQRCFDRTAILQNAELKKCLGNGTLVIGDKSIWSCLVWEEVNGICRLGGLDCFCYPDLTFYFDVEPDTIIARTAADPEATAIDRSFSRESLGETIYCYRRLCRKEPNWIFIDANCDRDSVWQCVKSGLKKNLQK